MKPIVDPFTQAAHCGECGAIAVDLVHAHECCAVEDPPARAPLIACGIVLLAAGVFLLTLPLWT